MSESIQLLQDEHITWEALGLITFLMAHPGQGFTIDELLMNSKGDSRERLKNTIRYLVKNKRARFANGQVFAFQSLFNQDPNSNMEAAQ